MTAKIWNKKVVEMFSDIGILSLRNMEENSNKHSCDNLLIYVSDCFFVEVDLHQTFPFKFFFFR